MAVSRPESATKSVPAPPPPPPKQATSPPVAPQANIAPGGIPAWAGNGQDEPFDVKAFLASRAAPTDNAAPHYERALALVSGIYGNDQAESLEQQIRDLADVEKLANGEVPILEVERVLAASAEAIQRIDAAQAKPRCIFVTGFSADTQLQHAQASLALCHLCILQLYQAKEEGDFMSAKRAVQRCLRLSRDLRPRGGSVSQLVSVGIDGRLFAAIQRLTLSDPKLTSEQCDQLLELVIEHDQHGVDCFDEGMRMDYLMARCSLDDLRTGRLTVRQLIEFQGIDVTRPGFDKAMQMNYDAEVGACNYLFRILLAASNNSSHEGEELKEYDAEVGRLQKEWNAFIGRLKRTPSASRPAIMNEMPAIQITFCTGVPKAFRAATCRISTHLAGLQMLIALRRHELAHGMLPQTLEAAATETAFKTTPIDPYSGQPLKWAIVDGCPTVYSIGMDRNDDGGRSDWKFGTQPGDYLFVLPPRQESKLAPPTPAN